MNNGEFYTCREYNYVGENKPFPAEEYRRPFEENTLGNEQADSGREITTLQRTDHSRKKKSQGFKNPMDKLFDSVRSIATSATVAVSAIVITSTVITGTLVPGLDLFGSEAPEPDIPGIETPEPEIPGTEIPDTPTPEPTPPIPDAPKPTVAALVSIDAGSDYVEFEIEITDIGEKKCYVTLTTEGKAVGETEISEDGIHAVKFEGLSSECEYIIKAVSRDGADGETVLLEESFTTGAQEYIPEPPPDSYTGELTLPEIDLSDVDWDNKRFSLPITFENTDGKYYYILKVADGNGNLLQSIRGEGDQTATVNIPDGNDRYAFTFEIYGVGEVEERLIESHDVGTYTLQRPKASVTGVKVVGINTVGVSLSISNADKVTLRFTFKDGSYSDYTLTSSEKSAGYAEIELPETATEFTVTPTVTRNGYTLSGSVSNHVIENNLQVETRVNLSDSDMSINFNIKAMMNGATRLRVTYSGTSEDIFIFDGVATYYYSDRGPMTLTLCLTNDLGDILSEEITLTVDTAGASANYVFNYSNPSDVGVTYNTNGTINIYAYTGFECADPDYYWQVMLDGVAYTTKEKVLEVKNMPNETYSIQYAVCFEKDGIVYTVYTVYPSGVVNEVNYYPPDMTLSENLLTINVYDKQKQDLNTMTLTASDGQQISLSESDFVSDENGGFVAIVTFDNPPEYVTVDLMISPFMHGLEFVESYVGSPYLPYSTEIYP